jgi:hypothetical protein
MTWMNLKPVDQLDNASYAIHGDIRMINVSLSTQTELLEDVRTVEEEVAEEEERRQFVRNYVLICDMSGTMFIFVICQELHSYL